MKRKFTSALLITCFLFTTHSSFSQCTILTNAVQGISYTYVTINGTNASGVAYNPTLNIYYAVTAGNPGFPFETFTPAGTSLYQTNAGFDFRGLWWNPNTNQLEGNGYYTYGLWKSNLDINGYALNTGTNLFIGQFQPDAQSVGDYDYDANEIIYYFNGFIYRYDRNTNVLLGSYPLTGMPVSLSNINWTSVVYTGCCGNEIGILDYINKTILLFSKTTGAYSGTSKLPASAVTNYGFNTSYANNLVWLHDIGTRTWTSYSILAGANGSNAVDLGNDTVLCVGSTLELNAGSSSDQYLWSTGATDSIITIDTAGSYWITVTTGLCSASDTIIISDTLCTPLISFNSSDTAICQKFCINFFDSSQNDPTAWLWLFEGASPSSSTNQNPTNICYNSPGTYDVKLITTSASGKDSLLLPGYINVYATPAMPAITQVGYTLTSSAAATYQWQLNANNIAGATNQSYTILQSGFYNVIAYDDHGCFSSSATIYVLGTGINNVAAEFYFTTEPNPSNGNFTISFQSPNSIGEIKLELIDLLGRIVFTKEIFLTQNSFSNSISVIDLPDGNYLLRMSSEKYSAVSKLVISK
ncbi:MAG: T9SS type A sorting domain-containing protein [Chitinophagales bacterium]|nr:T9SS type A sorting domain-containing protein [Chitinophagales bacterium]